MKKYILIFCLLNVINFFPTELHDAVKDNNEKKVRQLLSGKRIFKTVDRVNPNIADSLGNSPLHYAVRYQRFNICESLLQYGADVKVKNKKGESSYDLACGLKNNLYKKLLSKYLHTNVSKSSTQLSPEQSKKLFEYINNKDFEGLRSLIGKGADVNIADNGMVPLHQAVKKGFGKAIACLIANGANPNVQDNLGALPLHYAVQKNKFKMVKFLISHDALVDLSDNEGNKPLHFAAWNGNYELVEILITVGADVNATNKQNETPLFCATTVGHYAIVQQLLDRGADKSIKTDDKGGNESSKLIPGKTALEQAQLKEHITIIDLLKKHEQKVAIDSKPTATTSSKILLDKAQKQAENEARKVQKQADKQKQKELKLKLKNEKRLLSVTQKGSLAEVEALLAQGVDINCKNENGSSPLIIASFHGHLAILKLLLSKQCDKNMRNNVGDTALYLATIKNHQKIVDILICNNVDQSIAKNGKTPFEWARQKGMKGVLNVFEHHHNYANYLERKKKYPIISDDILKLTDKTVGLAFHTAVNDGKLEKIKHILTVFPHVRNVKNKEGETALFEACAKGKSKTVTLLLSYMSDITISSKKGTSPFQVAARNGHKQCVDLLQAHADKIKISLSPLTVHEQTAIGNIAEVKKQIHGGFAVNTPGIDNKTILHYAAVGNRLEITKFLIGSGADVNARDQWGYTPLHRAAEYDSAEVAKLLIDKDALLRSCDQWKYTSLHRAADNGSLKVASLLVEKGADVNARDQWGYTPLHRACRNGHLNIVKVLFSKMVDKELKDDFGITPFLRAAQEGHVEISEFLLGNGADVFVLTQEGDSIFHLLAQEGVAKAFEWALSKCGKLINTKNNNGLTPLHVAARNKNHIAISFLLRNGALFAAKNNDGFYSFQYSIQEDDLIGFKLFCEYARAHNINIKSIKFDGKFDALAFAVTVDALSIFRFLVGNGFDLKQKINKTQPLHLLAMQLDAQKIMREFVERYSISINTTDKEGYALLHHAAIMDAENISRYLIKNGAKINDRCGFKLRLTGAPILGRAPLNCAALNGSVKVGRVLLENKAKIDIVPKNDGDHLAAKDIHKQRRKEAFTTSSSFAGLMQKTQQMNLEKHEALRPTKSTPLHAAAIEGYPEMIRLLLEFKAPIAPEDLWRNTPLHNAANHGNRNCAFLLIRKGARDAPVNKAGKTPLDFANDKNHRKVINLLQDVNQIKVFRALDRGNFAGFKRLLNQLKNNNCKDECGRTVLHGAVLKGSLPMVKDILSREPKLNIKDTLGNTALHYAVKKKQTQIIQKLLESDASVGIVDSEGKTAYNYAIEQKDQAIIKFFGLILSRQLLKAVDEKDLEKMKVLLNAENCTIRNAEGSTLLHLAVEANDKKMVDLLVEYKILLNTQDNNGNTPLHLAAAEDSAILVRLLLAKNVRRDIKNSDDFTALEFADEHNSKKVIRIFQNQVIKSFGPMISTSTQTESDVSSGRSPKPLATQQLMNRLVINADALQLDKKPLAVGGYGQVFKGKWDGQPVAVKQLLINNLSRESMQEFKDETKIWFDLRHPNIVQLYGICLPPAPYSMVMPFMKHGSLYTLLKKVKLGTITLDWDQIKKIARGIIAGLHYLHEKNIVHRDLKSLNILMEQRDGEFKPLITDFGLSVVKNETQTQTLATAGPSVGTRLWMAPELFVGKKPSRRSDIWAYGMILRELVTKEVPFANVAQRMQQTLAERGHFEALPSETPSDIVKLIKWCCALKPAMRPVTEDVMKALMSQVAVVDSIQGPSATISTGSPSSGVLSSRRRKPPSRKLLLSKKKNSQIELALSLLNKVYPYEVVKDDENALAYRNETLGLLKKYKSTTQLSTDQQQDLNEISQELKSELAEIPGEENQSTGLDSVLKS